MSVTSAELARAGFQELRRGASLLEDLPEWEGAPLLDLLGRSADPDQAALGLVRLHEQLSEADRREIAALLTDAPDDAAKLVCLFGASTALTDAVVRRPEWWREVVDARLDDTDAYRSAISAEVGERTGDEALDALRVGYRRQLVRIAAVDVCGDSVELLPQVAQALADIAGGALQAALEIACREQEGSDRTRLAIMAMGKCGARELNYISDVDVVFAAEPADGVGEDEAVRIATRLASEVMRICSAHTGEGTLWEVDAALRPEGKQGQLVRTVASHRSYYERWAKTWEFQALLKARPVAGDPDVGQQYLDAVQPFIWQAAGRENFVEDVQAMRRRVEAHIPAAEAARQIKLGPGGLRDVEFSMQLLQLVHGRTDERLRLRSTLAAVDALSRRGYVGRGDANDLDHAYRVLRALEHRIQLWRMKRTHLMPTSAADLRRLGRGLGIKADPEDGVKELRANTSREVRRLYERIFYRPLLSAVAKLSDDDARLTPESAADRLRAIGYRDPKGAIRHMEALTAGVSRRAAIQRTLLPVMLQWFAEEADPDQGLLAFRKISEALGQTPWYLKMLRDEGSAAEILARVLANSRYIADLLERAPSASAMLGDPRSREPRTRDEIVEAMRSAARRHDEVDRAVNAVRSIRRRELIRIGIAQLSRGLEFDRAEVALTDITEALLEVLLEVAHRTLDEDAVTRVTVIGMGRLGGREASFASDADVMFVHDPLDGADAALAQKQAETLVNFLRKEMGSAGPDPKLPVDADLRPEGKAGPIVRTFDSYAAYYERWSEGWEAQALLRARPVAGDEDLGRRFVDLIDPLRYPEGGISVNAVRSIRTLKARMEAERIPRGGDRKRHFKLGHGGLSDVEWTVQTLQLQHAHEVPALRSTSTLTPLKVLADHGHLTHEDAELLRDAWVLAGRLRNASVLWRGRAVDSLPADVTQANGIARVMGLPAGSGPELGERYLRAARKARHVVEQVFYGEGQKKAYDPYEGH